MALLQKIKEKLGFGTGSAERDEADTEVTVESDPAADDEAGTDDRGEAGTDDRGEAEPAAGAEAAASTGPLVDEEPSEVDGSGTDESGGDEVAADESGESVDAADAVGETETSGDDETGAVAVDDDGAVGDDVGTDVEELKGIGPAYAERLAEIGIESVEDLAAADAASVAEGASVGEKRAATWIDRATEF